MSNLEEKYYNGIAQDIEKKVWEKIFLEETQFFGTSVNKEEKKTLNCVPRNSFSDKVFFFTTTFDRETKTILFRQYYRRRKPNRRCQESKSIWDVLDSGFGQESTPWTTRNLRRKKNWSWSSHISIRKTFFYTSLLSLFFSSTCLKIQN